MEGFQWIRISTIVAMFVGAIYILLPTILQQDAESMLGDKAGSVQTSEKAPDLKLRYRVENGEVDAALSALQQRLAGNSDVSRVQRDDGIIEVVVNVGSEPENVAAVIGESHDVTVSSVDPGTLALADGQTLVELASTADAAALTASNGLTKLDLSLEKYSGFGPGVLSGAPSSADTLLAIAVDGTVTALASAIMVA